MYTRNWGGGGVVPPCCVAACKKVSDKLLFAFPFFDATQWKKKEKEEAGAGF